MKFSKLSALLLAVLLAMLAALPVLAAENRHNFVTVTNDILPSGLAVTKTVTAAGLTQGQRVPNADFRFVLELDGVYATGQKYRVFDSTGEELLLFYDPGTGNVLEKKVNASEDLIPMDHTTDKQGGFTLKAGYTALFEGLSAGQSYRVTEENDRRDFTQVSPINQGAYSGVFDPSGVTAEFINRYQPETPGGSTTQFMLSKYEQLPSGYTLPQSEQEFPFIVLVDEEPWADKPYTVYPHEDPTPVRSGTTDAEGRLTLKAGEMALVAGIPLDAFYEVYEEDTEGWVKVLGEKHFADVTGKSPIRLDFINRRAAFTVKKLVEEEPELLEDLEPEEQEALRKRWAEEEFIFQLTTETDEGWMPGAEVEYFLCGADGEPLDEEQPKYTTSVGQFTLKHGQSALFTGIPLDTRYAVRESIATGYKQVFPENPSGYPDERVGEELPIHLFINRPEDNSGRLKVSKNVVSEGEPIDPHREYTFRLTRWKKDDWYPVAAEPYLLGTESLETGEDGLFTLLNGQTAVFDLLAPATDYKVEELGVWDEDEGEYVDYGFRPVEGNPQYVRPLGEEGADLLFTNTNVVPAAFRLTIHKQNTSGEPLAGVEFRLYRDDYKKPDHLVPLVEEGDYRFDEAGTPLTLITGEDGSFAVTGLEAGVYYLVETKAAKGYMLLSKPVKLRLSHEGESQMDDFPLNIDADEYGAPTADAAIVNRTIFEVPNTGMPLPPILSAGVLVIGVAALLLYIYIFRERRHDKKRHPHE